MSITLRNERKSLYVFYFLAMTSVGLLGSTHLLLKYRAPTTPPQKEFKEITLPQKNTQGASVSNASTTPSSVTALKSAPPAPTDRQYLEVIDACGPHFDTGECLNVRSGPGTEYPVVTKLRNGVVLLVTEEVVTETGRWYSVTFDEWLRYPERVQLPWYVAAQYVRTFRDTGTLTLDPNATTTATSTKRIVVDRSSQTLVAYDGETVFMRATTSTGRDLTPTPRGEFTIFKKTPSRYMQGPLPYLTSSHYYDLPGVPWNLYFTEQGAVIHGAYWHDSFGLQYSNGCVNLPPATAEVLYRWADVGTKVTIRD